MADHLQSGGPPFQPLMHGGDCLLGKCNRQQLTEKGLRCLLREAKVFAADLEDVAACPIAGQWQRRLTPAGKDDVERRRQVVEEEVQGGVDRGFINHVVVVEDEHQMVGEITGDVDKCRQHRIAIRVHRAEEKAERAIPDAWLHFLPRGKEIPEEAVRVVVFRAE